MVGLSRNMQGLCQLAPIAVQTRIGNARTAAQRLQPHPAQDFSCLALVRIEGLRCKAVRGITCSLPHRGR
ncbi:hypothetical protein CCL08_20020 [Pseudomonas congelans]|nr:hypothetical protein CCL08_20020 [Pseudomonas congelans]